VGLTTLKGSSVRPTTIPMNGERPRKKNLHKKKE